MIRLSSLTHHVKTALYSGFLSAALIVAGGSAVHGLTATLPNDSSPPTYLGIAWYPNFDGYATEVGAYYDTWDPTRTFDILGSMMTVDDGSNCRSPDPNTAYSYSPAFSSTEAYMTVTISVQSGPTLTYRINRANMCAHLNDGVLNTLNSRSSLSSARFIGRYQLPNVTQSSLTPDPETGKYKVNVKIAFTDRVIGYGTKVTNYNPNAYFRVRANGGIAASLGSSETGDTRKLNTRKYTDNTDWYNQTVEFGSPCSIGSGEKARIGIYDPDNYDNYPTLVSGTQNYGLPFRFYVEEMKLGDASYTPLPASAYTLVGTNRSKLVTLSTGTVAVEPITERPPGDTNNSPSSLVDFVPKAGAKYRMQLVDVYAVNFLQIVVPYDGIFNAINCTGLGGAISQKLVVNPDIDVVETGQPLTGQYFGSSTAPSDVPVSYEARIWYDSNGDGSYQPSESGNSQYYSGTGTLGPNAVNTKLLSDKVITADIARGGRICFSWNVTPTDPLYKDSQPNPTVTCVYIGFTPKAQIWGNDIRVGSGLDVSQNVASAAVGRVAAVWSGGSSSYSGSWSEYGIFAPRHNNLSSAVTSVKDIASASGLTLSGAITPTQNQADWSKLTFANNFTSSIGSCQFGCFAPASAMGLIPNIESYITNNGLADGTLIEVVSNEETINANIPPDPSGKQRIIVAQTIKISPNVTEVNAWLIARDNIHTCFKGNSDPTITSCDKPLRINGPVMANKLYLTRIGYAAADPKDKIGETINLRGDAYIWAHQTTHRAAGYQTTGIKELPPRY